MNNPSQGLHDAEDPDACAGKSLEKAPSWAANTRFELVLDGKTKLFPLPWIPIRTASAIHLTSGRSAPTMLEGGAAAWVDGLTKLWGSEGEQSNLALTESDWNELYDVWRDLPPINLPMPESQFEPYQAAVLRSKHRLTFDLQPMFDAGGAAVETLIRGATSRHLALLKHQVQERVIVPRDPSTMEAKPGEWNLNYVLTLEELRKFAGQLLISVRVDTSSTEANRSADTLKTPANPLGVPWRGADLGTLEKRQQLLAKFRQLGGSVDKDGRLHSETNALASLARLDGRKKDSLREQLQKAAKAEAIPSDVDAQAPTASKWFPQLSGPTTLKR